MKTAKLMAFEPSIDKDSVHKTFSASYGRLWKFIVEFDNGDKGEASSTKQEPTWQIGEEFSYELVVNGVFSNIRTMTPTAVIKRAKKTTGDWQLYCAQKVMKILVEINPTITTKEIQAELADIIPAITNSTDGSLETEAWFLSLNSVDCLLRRKAEISTKNIKKLNDICWAYKQN